MLLAAAGAFCHYLISRSHVSNILAEEMGVATSYIGQIEAAGMYKPISLTTRLRIARALSVPAYKFLDF